MILWGMEGLRGDIMGHGGSLGVILWGMEGP